PLSKDFQTGSIEQAERFLGFPKEQASILVLGGSQGALQLNELASRLCTQHPEWNIILIAGPGKKIALSADNLRQYEYLDEELISLIKKADLVVTRAGATFLFELALAGKAMLILPLLTSANNHQYYNAQYFKELSMVIDTNQSLDAIYQDLETNILRYWSGQISLDLDKLRQISQSRKRKIFISINFTNMPEFSREKRDNSLEKDHINLHPKDKKNAMQINCEQKYFSTIRRRIIIILK
nr:UDP-N-acetylglucosamine--N-acetylmuramyl-(pentapeptide) pyrophosphoryl-undecaprenol N-acetylglucosamine transferase [Candidatus Gracilibacteria bacterium]